MSTDYYSILGIKKSASKDEIKKSYRELAKKYHPDKTKGDKELEIKFKEINDAYETLGDDKKRASYDTPFSGGMGGYSNMGSGASMEEMFARHFGTVRRPDPNRPTIGRDIKYMIDVTLYDIISGENKIIDLSFNDICQDCSGKGFKSFDSCVECDGSGMIRYVQNQGNFRTVSMRPCNKCNGVGQIGKGVCSNSKCSSGVVKTDVNVSVKIPKNSKNGSIIRISGKGMGGTNGGPRGSMFLQLNLVLPSFESLTDTQKKVLKSLDE